MSKDDVLVVGAGPTGLTLALFLKKAGLTPRIIDKNFGPGQASRALGVQGRTLEFYRQLGIADEVVGKGIQMQSLHLRRQGREVAQIRLADFGAGSSPYPFVLSFPQDEHERLLIRHLEAAGIGVEWQTELLDLRNSGCEVQATLRARGGAEEQCVAAYAVGCDGARSAVRRSLNLAFAGGTYDKTYFVADVEAEGQAAAGHSFSLCLGSQGALLVLPVRSTGMHRLIGVIPQEIAPGGSMTFESVRELVEKEALIRVPRVNWFSTYQAHHRVAEHFQAGRVFLAGDAGHIHSPVGGQGMNTGIGDSVNLAWKLAAVLQGRAAASLLDTYESERIAFAHTLVATTDKVFTLMTGSGPGPTFFRNTLLPSLAPWALRIARVRRGAFRRISQIGIHYRHSLLSDTTGRRVHGVRGGDRLPWVRTAEGADNFVPLRTFDWQVHVYGKVGRELQLFAQKENLPLHEFDWLAAMAAQGIVRDALYLVRPDGYVALADYTQNVAALQSHLGRFDIRANGRATVPATPRLAARHSN